MQPDETWHYVIIGSPKKGVWKFMVDSIPVFTNESSHRPLLLLDSQPLENKMVEFFEDIIGPPLVLWKIRGKTSPHRVDIVVSL